MGSMDTYDADFEAYLLADSATYYQRKAAAWIQVPPARARMRLASLTCRHRLACHHVIV